MNFLKWKYRIKTTYDKRFVVEITNNFIPFWWEYWTFETLNYAKYIIDELIKKDEFIPKIIEVNNV